MKSLDHLLETRHEFCKNCTADAQQETSDLADDSLCDYLMVENEGVRGKGDGAGCKIERIFHVNISGSIFGTLPAVNQSCLLILSPMELERLEDG